MIEFAKKLFLSLKHYFLLLFLLLAASFLMSVSEMQGVQGVRKLAFASYSFFTNSLLSVTNFFIPTSEIESIKLKNAELMLENNKLRELIVQNEELKSLLGFKDTTSFDLEPAYVTSRFLSNEQVNFTINKGAGSGLKIGMPVITGKGLAGIITEVTSYSSNVQTIKNYDLKLVVRNDKGKYSGIMKWTNGKLLVKNLPKTAQIERGDRIITSPESSIVGFPVAVGYVKEIIDPEKGMFNDIVLIPAVDVDRIDYVFVIKHVYSKQRGGFELNYYNRNE